MAPPKKKKPQAVGVASVQRSNTPLIIGIAATIAVLVIIAVVVAVVGNNNDDSATSTANEWQPISATGTALTQAPSDTSTADPAVGTEAPSISGMNFDSQAVNITNDGRAKAIMFFAHWCPHCQNEAPKLSTWINDNASKYSNLDYYAVFTATDAQRANFPPSEWYKKLDFPSSVKVIVDDHANDASNTYGLSSYPYMLFIGADGKVVSRTSGEIGTDLFGQYVAAAAGAGVTPTTGASDPAAESSPAVTAAP